VSGSSDGFDDLLRQYRTTACLTQEELAHRSGLSVRTLSDMERGHTARPLIRSVRLLADALDLDLPARTRLIAAAYGDSGEPGTAEPDGGGDAAPAAPETPRQLPAPVRPFSGRSAELAALTRALDRAAAEGAVMVSVIGGMPGVGKTALAVHWAHQVARRFPDGQLYVDLRGFGPAGRPAVPGEAVRGFLDALGVPAGRVPAGLDAQTALYRSLLAARRMLVVADNARDEQQVRPLLPGVGQSAVVVTSRRQLAGLTAIEGADHLSLGLLSDREAWELLAARLGAARLSAEPRAAAGLIEMCAGLPLALAVTGARAAVRPAIVLASLASELRDRRNRLDALDDTDPLASIRVVFSWSCQDVSGPAARMFRLLGVHPGPDISIPATASLAAVATAQARMLLGELTGCHMLTELSPGRFALHDLLRAYAAEQAGLVETDDERAAARARIYDHYLHSAHGAALLLSPSRDPVDLSPPVAGVRPEGFDHYGQAMNWFTAEHKVLLAVADDAAATGSDAHAWQLPWTLETFLDRQGHWRDLAATQATALAAAERQGDLVGQAHMHRNIGNARFWLSSYEGARAHLSRAAELYARLGDRVNQARVQIDLARVYDFLDQWSQSLVHSGEALSLFQEAGHKVGQSYALNAVGWSESHLGDHASGLDHCQQALDLACSADDRVHVACTWDSLGYIRHQLGQHAEAITCYENALALCRELGNRHNQAEILNRLGDTWQSAGDPPAARDAWQRALLILDDLGHHHAAQVRDKLTSLDLAR